MEPEEVDRLRKVLDFPPPQPLEPTNDQLALELASKQITAGSYDVEGHAKNVLRDTAN